MNPVKVTATLSSPAAGQDVVQLDSLCELAVCESVRDDPDPPFPLLPQGQQVPVERAGRVPTPLAFREVCGWPVRLCSCPVLGPVHFDGHAHYHKQFPVGRTDLLTDRERTKIAPSGGRFKSFRLPLRTRLVEEVAWFAVADAEPLRALLGNVRAVCKKTSYGYGVVREWVVEPVDEDWSWFAESPDGPVLMRYLPFGTEVPDGLLGARRDFGAVVGPYWQNSLYCERWSPC